MLLVLLSRTRHQLVETFVSYQILAYEKNKLWPMSIRYIKNTNEDCFLGI